MSLSIRVMIAAPVLLALCLGLCAVAIGEEKGREERTREQLEALGYLPGYETAPEQSGVTVHLADLSCPGYNLFTSGHEQGARLIDMEGKMVHRWALDFREAFGDQLTQRTMNSPKSPYWRRVHLFPNGDLLAIVNYNGLIKIDRDSNLLWSVRRKFHHDLDVGPDGAIYALTYRPETVPWISDKRKVRVDYITKLSSEGKILRNISILNAFRDSSFSSSLRHMPRRGDTLHTNTIEVFDGSQAHRSPLFRKGNILVSMRSVDVIAIIDPEIEKVVWALSGQWIAQHQPTLLANGRLLLFDNRGHHGKSKVIEFDPLTQEICWSYEGDEENGFYTRSLGSNHRLVNGNTLIVESESGRVFEVTPGKQIVWEYVNPHRTEEDEAIIATVFDMERIEPSTLFDWLTGNRHPETN